MIKVGTDFVRGLVTQSQNQQQKMSELSDNLNRQRASSASVTVQLSHTEQQSFSLFQRTVNRNVSQALPARGEQLQPEELTEQELAEREERSSLAAGNILGFIEQRLRADQADGASTEELESRLNAALEGFTKGYEEASGILEDLNMLTPHVSDDIGLTKDKVLSGLEQFSRHFIDGEPLPEPELQSESQLVELNNNTGLNSFSRVSDIQLGQARDFSFQLETRDGDLVTINASALSASRYTSAEFSNGGANGAGQTTSVEAFDRYQQNQFGFTVEGELDDDELAAINDLLNNVNALATDFYAGDMNTAFQRALELDYDSGEISSFALSLTQVQNVRVMQAYQPEQEILKPENISDLRPIGKFATELSRSLTLANDLFSHPRDLLSDLTQQISDMFKPESYPSNVDDFAQFTQRLLDTLDGTIEQE